MHSFQEFSKCLKISCKEMHLRWSLHLLVSSLTDKWKSARVFSTLPCAFPPSTQHVLREDPLYTPCDLMRIIGTKWRGLQQHGWLLTTITRAEKITLAPVFPRKELLSCTERRFTQGLNCSLRLSVSLCLMWTWKGEEQLQPFSEPFVVSGRGYSWSSSDQLHAVLEQIPVCLLRD